MPNEDIDIRVETLEWEERLGRQAEPFVRAVLAAAAEGKAAGQISVLLADDETLRALNREWRGKDAPTNVLSFPAAPGFGLGDIALAWQTVASEARDQGKSFAAHAAHLLVHGYLHLLGFDHAAAAEAEEMERAERAILLRLGVGDPYQAAAP